MINKVTTINQMTKDNSTKKPIITQSAKIIATLRGMAVGESVRFTHSKNKSTSVRSTVSRLHKENNMRFEASEKGEKDAIVVTRIN